MNTLTIVGKIQRINRAESGKMCFITVMEKRTVDETNFIDCVCFSPEFINKHFEKGKWIGIIGHLHTSKYNDNYKTDVIIDSINFVGDKPMDNTNEAEFPSFFDDDEAELPFL